MSTSLRTLCSYTLLSTIVLSGEYWTPFFSPCVQRPYSLLLEALQNSAWGLRYPLWCWQSENQFNWKNQRWRSVIKIELNFFSPCTYHPCSFLLVDLQEWEWWCQIQPGGWDIHCGMDIAESLIEKSEVKKNCKKSTSIFFLPCAWHLCYCLLLALWQWERWWPVVPNSAWGLRYPLWRGQCKTIWLKTLVAKKHSKKSKRHVFLSCARSSCSFLLFAYRRWERWGQIQPGGWDIHYGVDSAKQFNWKKLLRRSMVKIQNPMFSHLAIDAPHPCCC